MNKALCLCLLLCLLTLPAGAELVWPEAKTEAQAQLQEYIAQVNKDLASLGTPPVNSIFELYVFSANLGITEDDGALIPEGTELAFELYDKTINTLVLRCSDPARFQTVAASCIHAAAMDGPKLQRVMNDVSAFVKRVQKTPNDSVKNSAILLNGDTVRTYYAYYPNLYYDKVNWYELTIVFAFTGLSEDVRINEEKTDTESGQEYEGWFQSDEGDHYEIFITPTPEPDSPAYGFWDSNP